MEPVKAKRRYDSSRRRAQAEATRGDILDAARRRFEQHGYAATSMDAIAAEAGVALKTVYVPSGPRAACCGRSGTTCSATAATTSRSPSRRGTGSSSPSRTPSASSASPSAGPARSSCGSRACSR